jgi:AcrR family transcriptional regulator
MARAYNSPARALSTQQTRDAILTAAEELIGEYGYAKTTIDQIAIRAGVASNTVYANVGGKRDLFLALLDRGTGAEVIDETLTRIDETDDGAAAIALVAFAYRRSFETAGAVLSVLDEAGRHDPAIADAVAASERLYRGRLDRVGMHLREIGALREGLAAREVSDVLWFYFGFTAWPQLRGLGWKADRVESWLAARATEALIRSS